MPDQPIYNNPNRFFFALFEWKLQRDQSTEITVKLFFSTPADYLTDIVSFFAAGWWIQESKSEFENRRKKFQFHSEYIIQFLSKERKKPNQFPLVWKLNEIDCNLWASQWVISN